MIDLLRCIRCDFRKTIIGAGFCLSVFLTALLCFFGEAYVDIETSKSYSVIEAAITLRDELDGNMELCSEKIFLCALSGYSSMALPVTASFPFVLAFIYERNGGNMRFVISRCGKAKYCLSKFITAALCGGLCTILGLAIYGFFTAIIFKPSASFPSEMRDVCFPNSVSYYLISKAASAFLYGIKSASAAFFICSFCTNAYVILCVPFLLKFMIETALSKIAANSADYEIYETLAPFQPNSISTIFDNEFNKTTLLIIAFNLLYIAACFFGFIFIMSKRADKGV